jgi:hypothetical protein
VSETGPCPYCGSASTAAGGLELLYREMRRIREIAEAHTSEDAERRIAELTRQVEELRAAVARLRGPRSVTLATALASEPGRRVS